MIVWETIKDSIKPLYQDIKELIEEIL
ncbi:hypothetical protein [Hippea maritima]